MTDGEARYAAGTAPAFSPLSRLIKLHVPLPRDRAGVTLPV